MDKNIKAFVMHVSFLGSRMTINPARKAQSALLLAKEVTVPAKYLDFANVFFKESANVLPEQTGVNKHTMELEMSRQPPYEPIYSLGPVELKTLKTLHWDQPGQ